MQRVKVYRLNSDGLWDDKGTGHVSVEYLEVRLLLPCSCSRTACPNGSDASQIIHMSSPSVRNVLHSFASTMRAAKKNTSAALQIVLSWLLGMPPSASKAYHDKVGRLLCCEVSAMSYATVWLDLISNPLSQLVCVPVQQSDSLGLVVISEEDTHRTLLIHRIVFEDIYYRQGGESQGFVHLHRCLLCMLPGAADLSGYTNPLSCTRR